MPNLSKKLLLGAICFWLPLAYGGTPSASFADRYDDLSQAALDGDSAAALELGLQLQECFVNRHVLTDRAINVTLENAQSAPTTAARQSLERLASRYDRLKTLCGGLSEDDMESGIEWLLLAAQSGSREALTLLHQTIKTRVEPPSEKLAQYAQQAVTLLEEKIEEGDGSFTLTLANVYDQGIIVDRDPILAAAYAHAFELVDGSPRSGRVMESIATRYSLLDTEIKQAKAMGRRIASCCTKGDG